MRWLFVAWCHTAEPGGLLQRTQRASKERSLLVNYISELQTAVSGSRRFYRAAFSSEELVCGVVVWSRSSMGTAEEDWGVPGCTQLFLMSSGSLRVSVGALVFLLLHRGGSCLPCGGANYLKMHFFLRATSGYQRGQRWLTADPGGGRRTGAWITAVGSSV